MVNENFEIIEDLNIESGYGNLAIKLDGSVEFKGKQTFLFNTDLFPTPYFTPVHFKGYVAEDYFLVYMVIVIANSVHISFIVIGETDTGDILFNDDVYIRSIDGVGFREDKIAIHSSWDVHIFSTVYNRLAYNFF